MLAQTESVFALSNGHIGWRGKPRRGRAARLARLLPQRSLRAAAAAVRRARLRLPGVRADGDQRHQRQADPPDWSTTNRLTSATAELRAHERCLDFRAGVLHRRADWISPAGCAVRVSSTRLVSLVQRSIAAIRYEVEALDRPMRVVVQSELVANEQLPAPSGDPRVAAALGRRWSARKHAAKGARAGLVHSTRRSGLRIAAVMDHVVDGPPGTVVACRELPAPGAGDGDGGARAGPAAAAGQVRRLRLVRIPVAARGARSGRRGAGRGNHRPAGTGCCAEQRAYLDDFWDSRRRAARRGPRNPAGGAVRAVSRAAGRGPRRGPRDPGKGPDRPRLRRAQLLGHRSLRAAGAHLHGRPRRRRARAALAALHPADGHRACHASSGCAVPRSRGAPSTAKNAPATGPPAPPRSTSAPTSPTRSSATSTATGDQAFERDRRPRTADRDRAAVALLWATTTPRAASASTGSPARTSTAPSPTTTSTPT